MRIFRIMSGGGVLAVLDDGKAADYFSRNIPPSRGVGG